ncbi:MAG: DUF4097 family beta strand repeat protein [Acidobacteria bacterium]|nr:DUF4097 family beta strand repeat protein [Acidobacteriota bacterium]
MRPRAVAITLWALCSISLTASACGGVPALLADGKRAEGTFSRTLQVTGPVSLDISTGSGRVVVVSGAAGHVVVEGQIRANEDGMFGRLTLDPEERVRRLVSAPPVEQSGGSIRIGHIDDEDLRRNISISYRVTVPADTAVVSRTGSGSQQIEGLARDVTVTTGSGSIRLRQIGGAVRASTGSGSIVADGIGGDFDARTGSGPIEGTGVSGRMMARTGSGGIRLAQSGPGDVDVSAGSGRIDLSGIRGGVRAHTSSGSLTVSGEQTADWRLSTSSGSVDVDLAGSPAFDLDASGGSIETEYPITVTGSLSRRRLRGAVNGGGPLLQVQTSSGRVRIR